jgi:mitochondrial Rho GTPase 1
MNLINPAFVSNCHSLNFLMFFFTNIFWQVPVIVAENKMDLFRPSSIRVGGAGRQGGQTDEQALARKRQQIVSLMQRFPFVRQCIKCSAKNLLRVDDVFLKAQQAVLYPFVPPLYDLETGQLTIECKRAFTRIFRMFDKDQDGLLSDSELEQFQRDTYRVPVFERDLAAWKKVVTRNNPSETNESVLQDGKFTIQGFLTIFDIFISQNRLDVVWQALRHFNYDDDLNLHVPESILNPYEEPAASSSGCESSWKLSSAAKRFLTQLFRQFDSDHDGLLAPDDVVSMFSILPPPGLPPWHPMRAPELFEGCFSVPKESPTNGSSSGTESPDFNVDTSLIVPAAMAQSLISSSGVSILSASDSLPSVDVGGMFPLSKSLSYLEWMGHWHAISAISPSIARAELYRLGHVENYNRKKSRQSESHHRSRIPGYKSKQKVAADLNPDETPGAVYHDTKLRSKEIRVLVLGSRGCGKTALLNALCGSFDATSIGHVRALDTSGTSRPETSAAHVKVKRCFPTNSSNKIKMERDGEEFVVHLVFTDVPEAAAARQEEHCRLLSELFGSETSPKDRVCDLAMLVFDCENRASFHVVKELESTLLSKETPRVFVGTKTDRLESPERSEEIGGRPTSAVFDEAAEYCRQHDLEPPLLTNASESGLGSGGDERTKALDHLARCALLDEPGFKHLKSRPHEEQKRRDAARRRKMMWLGGIVSVGVVVAVGVGLLWGGSAKKDQTKGTFGWFRSFFSSSARPPQGTPQSS